jgi:hypothetical protein
VSLAAGDFGRRNFSSRNIFGKRANNEAIRVSKDLINLRVSQKHERAPF